jgi:hypothetical protein
VGSIIRVYKVEKEKTFYLKFEQGIMSKTHKFYFPISHTHTHTHTHTFHKPCVLTLILLMWSIGWAPNNSSKWQMGFNSTFKGLMLYIKSLTHTCNSLHMFTCEPKTVQVQQNLNILFVWDIHTYIYIYVCVCVCVSVNIWN